MTERRINAQQIGFAQLKNDERQSEYSYGDLNRFPVYFGTHPAVMNDRVAQHHLSQQDLKNIRQKFWWYPGRILKLRYKSWRRVKEKIV